MAKRLVTGGAACIGSHLADLLIDHRFEVAILGDLSLGRATLINPYGREQEPAV